MTRRHLLLAAAFVAMAALLVFDREPATPEVATALPRAPAAAAPGRAAAPAAAAPTAVLALRARGAMLAEQRDGHRPERLFGAQSWAPPPPPPPAVAAPAPVAPPLPFAVVGQQRFARGPEVFLAEGEKLHIVHVGTVIDGRYRVEAIAANAVSLLYLPLNQIQQLALRAPE